MKCHAYLCRFSRLKPRNRLRKCVSAKSWCRSLESLLIHQRDIRREQIFFFSFFFLKRNDLVVAIFFSRAITFCVHDIFEKKEKCKSLSTDDTFDPSIFFFL